MNIKNIGNGLKKAFYATKFWAKKNSPELLIVAGIASAGAAIILACKETTKLKDITEPATKKIKELHDQIDESKTNQLIDPNISKKELKETYAKTGWSLVKLYAPSALCFAGSVACILGSHHIQKGRELAMAAAYTTVNTAYKEYRERVKAKYGEDAEYDILHNVQEKEVEYTETNKKGKEVVKTRNEKFANDNPHDFHYLFDESNPYWEPDSGLNLETLLMKERCLNNRFRIKGYMFLDEVYKELGIEPGIIGPNKMRAAKYIGWIYDPDDRTRDNYISFGLSDLEGNFTYDALRMKRQGERNVYLTFNPDGDILSEEPHNKTFMKFAKCW